MTESKKVTNKILDKIIEDVKFIFEGLSTRDEEIIRENFIIKQDSWNSDRKIGSFAKNKNNPTKRVITKLGRQEVAGIIDCLETNREFSTYHSSAKQVLQMKFCPYIRNGDQIGFSFAIRGEP